MYITHLVTKVFELLLWQAFAFDLFQIRSVSLLIHKSKPTPATHLERFRLRAFDLVPGSACQGRVHCFVPDHAANHIAL